MRCMPSCAKIEGHGCKGMASRAVFEFFTAKGVAEAGQDTSLVELRERLSDPKAKLLLHLHGGLVDRKTGVECAERLSGSGPRSFQLDPQWTQVYMIWQTGALEVIERRWKELAHEDQLYQALARKLIKFLAERLRIPGAGSRSVADAAPMDDDEILRRLRGEGDRREPFRELEEKVASEDSASRAIIAPGRSDGELLIEFNAFLLADPLFQGAIKDVNAAVATDVASRAAAAPGSVERGKAILERLDDSFNGEFGVSEVGKAPSAVPRGAVSVGAFLAGRALKAAYRCIVRFRSQRDHGLHATVVEEVCREFYGDKIGEKLWGWMVDDARLHFAAGGFGQLLLPILAAHPPSRMVVTAHSAGSIWASQMLLAMKESGATSQVDLCLLAPAVRAELFSTTIADAGNLIRRCHMFTMDDALERRDAVLGHDNGYVYPSSLLYLVSGLFEVKGDEAYPDAPIVGMQRFTGVDWLNKSEAADEASISEFFSQPDKAIHYSPNSGLTNADSHGGFDDNELTLKSLGAEFFLK
jgi:hypothetical protein